MAELADPEDQDLPETVGLSQREIDQYYPLWILWQATGKRFLPSQLLAEAAQPLAVLLELDGYYDRISRQIADEKRKEQDAE